MATISKQVKTFSVAVSGVDYNVEILSTANRYGISFFEVYVNDQLIIKDRKTIPSKKEIANRIERYQFYIDNNLCNICF